MIKNGIIIVGMLLSGALGAITRTYNEYDTVSIQVEQIMSTQKEINETLVQLNNSIDSTNKALQIQMVEVSRLKMEVDNTMAMASTYEYKKAL